jgi:hypothetical protein
VLPQQGLNPVHVPTALLKGTIRNLRAVLVLQERNKERLDDWILFVKIKDTIKLIKITSRT